MGGEDFLSAVGSIANALFLIASVYIYVALLRQINRRDRDPTDTDRGFGAAEVALAVFLIAVFAFSSLGAVRPKSFGCARSILSLTLLLRSEWFYLLPRS